MELGQSSIRGVLSGGKQFQIPLFQRSYSWEKAEWIVLLMDVLDQYRIVEHAFATHSDEAARNAALQGVSSHYLGTLVQADPSAVGISRVKLIDGQQRISTISIAICALRDRWKKQLGQTSTAADERAQNIDFKFVLHPGEAGHDKYRLLPQKRDRSAYQAITDRSREPKLLRAVDFGLNDADSDAMLKAYNYFYRAWDSVPSQMENYADLYPLDFDAVLVSLVDRLYTVTIEAVSTTDNVNAIFESLNTKGRALRQVDLLKNFIFLTLGSEAERVIEDHWSPIEGILGPRDLEHYVWAFTVANGHNILQNRTYETLQRRLRGQAGAIEQLVVDLKGSASLFDRILNPVKETRVELRRALEDLHDAGGVVWVPMALYCYRRFVNETHGLEELVDALRRIESFLVRRMLCDLAPNNLNSMFGTMLARLSTQGFAPTSSLPSDIGRLLASKSSDWPTDAEVRARVPATDYYHRQKTVQRIHILRRLDGSYSNTGVTPNYEVSDKSIEHIAPQNPSAAGWKDALPTDDWQSIQEELLHTLGNLTLLTPSKNSSLGDKEWAEKKVAYATAGYPMTVHLASSAELVWNSDAIRARSAELADRAIAAWPRAAEDPHVVQSGAAGSNVPAPADDEYPDSDDGKPVSDADLDEGWAAIQAEHAETEPSAD